MSIVIPRVKMCGLTRLEDAQVAVAQGASAVGFVFWPGSPRATTAAAAQRIAAALPALIVRVGVFVDAPPEDVASIVREVGLDAVQLHGDESVEAYATVGARIVKAVALEHDDAVARAAALPLNVTLLVDAVDPVRRGGTGRAADWSRAAGLARQRPLILAGGLTAETVGDAIRAVQPWAVDVSSGIELSPGIKSPDRMAAFMTAVRSLPGEE